MGAGASAKKNEAAIEAGWFNMRATIFCSGID